MNRKILSILLAVLLTACMLWGCGANPKQEATRTVYCMTGMTYTYDGITTAYDVTYEKDTIRLTPQTLSEGNLNYTYVYSPDGRLLSTQRQDENGTPAFSMTYTYNEQGKLTEILQMDLSDNTVASRNVYEYDGQGNLLQGTYYGREDRLSTITEYTYDAQGFLAEDLLRDETGEALWKHVYTCDDAGNILTCEEHILSESIDTVGLLGTYRCTYDDQGRLTANTWEKARTSSFVNGSHYYTYDAQGRLTRHQYFLFDDEARDDYNYSYDENGHLTASVDLGDNGSTELQYGELTLSESQAQCAENWTKTGIIVAYVPAPEFES